MPTFMAIILATTVSLALNRALPDAIGFAAKVPLDLLVWGIVYYVTFRVLTNLRPE